MIGIKKAMQDMVDGLPDDLPGIEKLTNDNPYSVTGYDAGNKLLVTIKIERPDEPMADELKSRNEKELH